MKDVSKQKEMVVHYLTNGIKWLDMYEHFRPCGRLLMKRIRTENNLPRNPLQLRQEQIADMYIRGLTLQELAKMFHTYYTAIAKIAKKYYPNEYSIRDGEMKVIMANTKHGETSGRKHGLTYTTWYNAKARCNNPNAHQFCDYGGRGIKFCERWNDFVTFKNDMGPRPGKEYCIERIDNDGNYEPSNCKWILKSEMCKNKRGSGDKPLTMKQLKHLQKLWAKRRKKKRGSTT